MNPDPGELKRSIDKAAHIIYQSKNGVALTGAGYSTPSGIPDFRSPQSGLWLGIDPTQVASLRSFRYHPEKFYAWFRSFAHLMLNAQPNPAHYSLSALSKHGHIQTVITQNIDGLHQRAGSEHVLEVHGGMDDMSCTRCFKKFPSTHFINNFLETGSIPICPECGGTLKPSVILFEEQLPINTWRAAEKACMDADLMLVAGSSLVVMPVAGLPMRAVNQNSPLIMVNKTPTYIDIRADVHILGDVSEIMPRILEAVENA